MSICEDSLAGGADIAPDDRRAALPALSAERQWNKFVVSVFLLAVVGYANCSLWLYSTGWATCRDRCPFELCISPATKREFRSTRGCKYDNSRISVAPCHCTGTGTFSLLGGERKVTLEGRVSGETAAPSLFPDASALGQLDTARTTVSESCTTPLW
jgi:hypothetical protein